MDFVRICLGACAGEISEGQPWSHVHLGKAIADMVYGEIEKDSNVVRSGDFERRGPFTKEAPPVWDE